MEHEKEENNLNSEVNRERVNTRGPLRALDNKHYSYRGKSRDKNHNQSVIKTTVDKLNLDYVRPQRAGIIIYTVVNGAIYFGLGLDSRSHDLTDFGGGINYRTDENVISGAIREFNEETLDIFENITIENIKSCPVIYDNKNLIVFVHLNIDPELVSSSFQEKYKQVKYSQPEVCAITWLNWEEFKYSISVEGIFYTRVQKFLLRADDFSYLL